ncbi:mycofactocin biosynthesis peptidyl-dipeptidase MftE [Actinocorallia sp. API 0066]|uniref:mycofactocin biosynthesis peptidyl-dipeptidase MftE n=1 Tax=Actinocorallia sp. API 0066 TaxID=2896846 RepID=UPI001E36E340|nr:mycofactocin biosynthesis peptidyl-dipeptidase MftE [Actinocorallia sp. API 0066]MCD0453281.1 mycofactocin biosynthesis peptidyl-dipeptidase MftE [Actinocorallia sp. API 0066]
MTTGKPGSGPHRPAQRLATRGDGQGVASAFGESVGFGRVVRLGDVVWPEVPEKTLVVVPVGATEQHGPHLPVDTDTVVAEAVAAGVAAALAADGPVLLAPAIAFGASSEHAGFPGTVSIGHEALRAVLVETVRSLALWAGRTVLVNGHGGNVATLETAVAQLSAEGHDVRWAPCAAPGGDPHAGFTETSVMLHLAPERVRLEAAVPGDTRPLSVLLPELRARGVRAVSPTGVLGDPTGATAAHGAEILRTMITTALTVLAHA